MVGVFAWRVYYRRDWRLCAKHGCFLFCGVFRMDKRIKALCGTALAFPRVFFLIWHLYGILTPTSLLAPRVYDAAFMRATTRLPQTS